MLSKTKEYEDKHEDNVASGNFGFYLGFVRELQSK